MDRRWSERKAKDADEERELTLVTAVRTVETMTTSSDELINSARPREGRDEAMFCRVDVMVAKVTSCTYGCAS